MKKYTNILIKSHFIHLDKMHLQIDDNSIIDFEPIHPIKLIKEEKYNRNYMEVYQIHYYSAGSFYRIGYLNHKLKVNKQHHISKIVFCNSLLYNNWLPLVKTLLSRLNINENYKFSGGEIALDTNENLVQRYYNMLRKNQIILKHGYKNPVVIPDANNRCVKVGSEHLDADTIYIQKTTSKGEIIHYNKTRLENKSNALAVKKKPYIQLKLSQQLDGNSPFFRIEQSFNLIDYAKATRNTRYYLIHTPDDKGISEAKYKKLNDSDKNKYEKGITQMNFSIIRIENLNDPDYLLILFNHFAKFNLDYFLGCPCIPKISFNPTIELFKRDYIASNLLDVFVLN